MSTKIQAPVPSRLLYTVPEAAALLGGVSENTVWNLLRDGELHGVKVRNRRMIPREELERYLAWLSEATG